MQKLSCIRLRAYRRPRPRHGCGRPWKQFWVVALSVPPGEPLLRGWVGMLGLILLLHFGAFKIIALLWQSVGVDAKAIMSAPLRSTSLGEFWGKRWNLGFRQLSHEL